MSKNLQNGNNSINDDRRDLLAFLKSQRSQCPTGVSIKLQDNKYLL